MLVTLKWILLQVTTFFIWSKMQANFINHYPALHSNLSSLFFQNETKGFPFQSGLNTIFWHSLNIPTSKNRNLATLNFKTSVPKK
jgi:hypothetical protein